MRRILVALALLLLPAAAAASPEHPEVSGTYLHGFAKAAFPKDVGGLKRTLLVRYDDAGRDVTGRYDQVEGDRKLYVTVYIYPAGDAPAAADPAAAKRLACADHFPQVKAAVFATYQARPADDTRPMPSGSVDPALSHRTVFDATMDFDGQDPQDVRSEIGFIASCPAIGW